VQGTVTKLATFGAFVRIDGSLEGLVHISELSDRKIMHPKEVVTEGDALTLKIVRIEPERHRLGLSLRQALDEYSPDYASPYQKSSEDLDDEDDQP
jgi:small subunit ribosomal protein S1